MTQPILTVEDLSILATDSTPVEGVSFSVQPGEVVGIVGESGSGKTLTSLAIARLLPRGLTAEAGRLEFDGAELSELRPAALRRFLGTRMAMVFQDPMSSLNPAMRVGEQLMEGIRIHQQLSRSEARARALAALEEVHIAQPLTCMRQYPHELSGGMRQRVMIAMGLMVEPRLLIADEPTTALDVTVQAQVMQLLSTMNREHGTAILLISHNIALLSEICTRVLVMYRGMLIDDLTTDELLAGEGHPYTRMLVRAVPDLATDRDRPLATVDELPGESRPVGKGESDA